MKGRTFTNCIHFLDKENKEREMMFLIKAIFRSCECECEEAIFGSEKAMCETRSTTFWDSKLENVIIISD